MELLLLEFIFTQRYPMKRLNKKTGILLGVSTLLGLTALTTVASNSALANLSLSDANLLAYGTPRCNTPQLSLRFVGSNPGAGNVYNEFAFTNISNITCTLYGYPGVELLNRYNKPVGVNVVRNGAQKTTVTLVPGGKAYFVLRYGRKELYPDYQNKCAPDSVKIRVIPPNTYNYLTILHQEGACREASVSPVTRSGF